MTTPTLTYVLPGRWWSVRLDRDPQEIQHRITRHVEDVVGRADDRATLRRQVREHLNDAVRMARELNAVDLHIAESLVDGVPFAGSLLVIDIGQGVPPIGSVAEQADTLLEMVGDDAEVVSTEDAPFPAVRRLHPTMARPDEGKIASTRADYWLAAPESGRVVLLSFTTALPGLEELSIELFDAIVSTVSFAVSSLR